MMVWVLLLLDDVVVNCKFEFEIFVDDVQCGYGIMIGVFDDQLKFYLMVCGILEKQVEVLLIEVFVGEVIDVVMCEDLCDVLLCVMYNWFEGR